jgi:site-specific DNA-methyltransferase (cytosine-N4-specific)
VSDYGIILTTDKLLDEVKLKKLTFYSEFYIESENSDRVIVPTDQSIIENYRNCVPNFFNEIRPKKTREIRYLTHSLHEYKGRFYPQLVKSLFNYAGLKKGDTVLDPFCGSGTTLVESVFFGVNAIGVDINPIAFLLTKAKVKGIFLTQKDLDTIKKVFENLNENFGWKDIRIKDYADILDIEYLKNWFPENNLKKFLFITEIIYKLKNETSQIFLKVILSNLLRKFSFQEPTQLRIRIRKDDPPVNLIETFKFSLFQQIENLEKFRLLNHFNLDSTVENYLGDARRLIKDIKLNKNSVDAVITSPPYATALPYVDTDRLSLFAYGYTNRCQYRKLEETLIGNREISKSKREILDNELEKNFEFSVLPTETIQLLKKIYLLNKNANVGFRRKNTASLLYKYFLDMYYTMHQISLILKKNKLAFFVIGNNKTTAGQENITIPTDNFISLIAESNNFKLVEKINIDVQPSHMIHSKNSINSESILILRHL